MNSLSALQEVWAAIAASPGCCRLLAVSVEVAVLAVAVWCLIRVLRIRSARVCSLLWILVLAKGLFGLAFGAPLEVGALRLTESARTSQSATAAMSAEGLARQEAEMQRALREAESSASASVAAAPNGTDGTQPSSPVLGAQVPRRSTPSLLSGFFASLSRFSFTAHAAGLLTAVWLAGVLWALLATALDLRRIRDLARASGAPSEELLAVFRAEAARLGIARVPALSVCAEVESPALAGFLRPTVLAPAWLAETADADQLRWMLAHELMHYKQKDTVGLLVRRAAQVALWFHPAVWWAGRQWEEAMERACDRALIAGEADARHYAEQLHGVLKSLMTRRSRTRVVTGLFATRTQIGKRIAALLTDSLAMPARLSPSSATLLVLLTVAALSCGVGVDQSERAKAKTKKEADKTSAAVAKSEPTPAVSEPPFPDVPERVTRVRADLRNLATALEAYSVDYGNYPSSFPALTTPVAYVSPIPADPFSRENPPHAYRLNADPPDHHSIVYSVGPDGADQNGLTVYDPAQGDNSAGDIVYKAPGTYLTLDAEDLAKVEKQDALVRGMARLVEVWYLQTRQGLPDSLETVVKETHILKEVPENLFVPGNKLSYGLAPDRQTAWIGCLSADHAKDPNYQPDWGSEGIGPSPQRNYYAKISLAELRERHPELPQPLDRRLLEHVPERDQYLKPILAALFDLRDREKRPNALLDYVAAGFVAPTYPDNAENALIQSVLASGWDESAEPLRPYLALWQPAFALIRQGVTLDDAQGIGLGEGLNAPEPYLSGVHLVAKALCVEGRYFESQGKLHEALDNYLTVVALGSDYGSPGNKFVSHWIGVYASSIGARQIRALIATRQLAPADLEHCRRRLEALDKDYPSIADGLRHEGLWTQRMVDRLRKDGNADGVIAELSADGDTAEFYRRAARDIDRVDAHRKQVWDLIQPVAELPWWQQDWSKVEIALPPFEDKYLFPMPNGKEANAWWCVMKAGLSLARAGTALEIYKASNGKYPASLDVLTPAQTGTVPTIDPFSGKPLLYLLEGDGYALWSVGPLGVNEDGAVTYDAKNGAISGGNIVLTVPPVDPAPTPANPAVPAK